MLSGSTSAYQYAEDAGGGRSERIARPTVLRGEDLGRYGVQDAVHDLRAHAARFSAPTPAQSGAATYVTDECVAAVPAQQRVGAAGRGAGVEEHPGEP